MEYPEGSLAWQSVYKLMTGAIVPRPIGWISTISTDGVPNLAPYSFFNAVCSNPPTVLFCPAIRGFTHSPKDTLTNARETGEFVVNIVSESTAHAMNITATDFEPEVDEFEVAGVTKVPSIAVKAPRVGESLVHFECKVTQIVTIGEHIGSASIVIGQIVHIHVDDSVLIGTDKIDLTKLKPVGRLSGNSYAYIHDIFDLIRR